MFNAAAVRRKAHVAQGTCSSTCSMSKVVISTTAAPSAATAISTAPSIDKYVCKAQPQGVMRGEKLVKANELLVKALTANLLPPALIEFRELLEFISNGSQSCPQF